MVTSSIIIVSRNLIHDFRNKTIFNLLLLFVCRCIFKLSFLLAYLLYSVVATKLTIKQPDVKKSDPNVLSWENFE